MRIILLSIVVSLTAGCSGLVDTIRKNQQKQQVYQQYASKYYASCQKEAFSYYPVAIVKREEPKIITQKPRESFSCTKWGNTVDCRDTTSGGYDELLNSTLKTANMVAGKTDTYDANEGSRNNHIKSCIDNNLRSDSQFIRARASINVNYKSNNLPLSRKLEVNGILTCYYGFEEKEYKPDFGVCPESLRIEPGF